MDAWFPYATENKRGRERTHRSRMARAVVAAVLAHLLLFLGLAPPKSRIPLVRHIGYQGVMQIQPEISVQREPDEFEAEQQTARGRGEEGFFRVLSIRVVDWEVPSGIPTEESAGEAEPEEAGEDLRTELERSLPQPTSSEVIITRFIKPLYPPSSIAAGVEGVVVFRLHVTAEGRVARVWLLNSEVDQACEIEAHRAVTQWKFRPFLVAGEPTAILVDQRIRFRLHDIPVVPAALRTHDG
jgi:TonB family protein